MEPTARDLKGLHREDLATATGEGNSRNRRTDYRETREEFIKAFNSRFLGDSSNPDTSFEELFTVVPDALARHNQLGISTDLGNSSEYSTPPNEPERELGMADEQENVAQAVAAVRQMPSYRHHTAPKFSEDQPRELRRFFEELANSFGPANITTEADKKAQTVRYVEVDTVDMWKSFIITRIFQPEFYL